LPYVAEPKFIQANRLTGFTCRSTDVGAVLDLMIHDIDIVQQLAGSEVVDVEAIGVSILTQHEDVAHTRIKFANGCIAELTASRASYESRRSMQVWTARGFTEVDFATNSAKIVEPSEAVATGALNVDALDANQKQDLTERLFDHYLPARTLEREPINALLEEQRDFVESIRTARAPRVTGRHGRDALALAHQILDSIAAHSWDGTSDGPHGSQGKKPEPILRGPHWHLKPAAKRAG
ncbi:MAG: Gfo/Idh/MocA family oxidoreductase, partial [Pirellulales bacterium]|nr:Gfo/Idh/MocA family oxidoreductase [Pirellulales bacterium]